MRKSEASVLFMHYDPLLLECVAHAARQSGLTIYRATSWDELFELGRSAPVSTVAIVDPFAGESSVYRPSPDLAALLDRLPSLPVMAAMQIDSGSLEHARRLGEWGVVQILDLDEERSANGFVQRLTAATGRPLKALLESSLPPTISGVARTIVRSAAEVVVGGGAGMDLARSFQITPRTLTRWCRRASLPPPRRLLGWMRVLLAAELLDDRGRTVSDVAAACGYSSDATLRQALRAFASDTPTALREKGAFRTVTRAFLNDVRAARSPDHRFRAVRS